MRRTVGAESCIYGSFVLDPIHFGSITELSAAMSLVSARRPELRARLAAKESADHGARRVEHACDALAERATDFAAGLDPATIAAFEPADARAAYLLMQEHLCDLSLAMRRLIGQRFHEVGHAARRDGGIHSSVVDMDAKPGFVYLLVSAEGVARQELITETQLVLRAVMAGMNASDGMAIVDQVGGGYHFYLYRNTCPSEADIALGRRLMEGQTVAQTRGALIPHWIAEEEATS